jgi:hypothetical protein
MIRPRTFAAVIADTGSFDFRKHVFNFDAGAVLLRDVVGFAAVLVDLVVAVGALAVVSILIALSPDGFGRIQRAPVAVGDVGGNIFVFAGEAAGSVAHGSILPVRGLRGQAGAGWLTRLEGAWYT